MQSGIFRHLAQVLAAHGLVVRVQAHQDTLRPFENNKPIGNQPMRVYKIWAAETTRLKRVDEAATTTPCKDRISAWTKAPKRRPMLCT